MIIKEIQTKAILTKSGLGCDYAINPYIGCAHGCIYCYARFMKRFTGHSELWGEFVDVKVNAADTIPNKSLEGKSILFGSVCDAYQPLESKYELMPKILKKLIPLKPSISILTKSDLVLRDISLLKQFSDVEVGFSIPVLDERITKQIEPLAVSAKRRIDALEVLKENGIRTHVFIAPILPFITDWKKIVSLAKDYCDEFWFDKFNPYSACFGQIKTWLMDYDKTLIPKYEEIVSKESN
jgi:DNA repair photolyase